MDSEPTFRSRVSAWLTAKGWTLLPFQQELWDAFPTVEAGLVNAATGTGKTMSVWIPALERLLTARTLDPKQKKLSLLWITPLRALAEDSAQSLRTIAGELGYAVTVGVRNSDTPEKERRRQLRTPPDVLVTTPESVHVLLALPQGKDFLKSISTVVVDEWHELLGTKRGVQVELALSHFRRWNPRLSTWALSATIGNLDQALTVLAPTAQKRILIKSAARKTTKMTLVLPDSMERFPWAGHLGMRMVPKVLEIIKRSRTTLVFTNTRSHTERWYQAILEADPELAGLIATHHGSLEREIRHWVEDALRDERVRVVVCTASLDLGVDLQPVDTVIQIGSPKSVARFLQRAGRSGHRPDASSSVYFIPTHALEIAEGVALMRGVHRGVIEQREPNTGSLDVLIQYLLTLALGEGFVPDEILHEVRTSYAYRSLTKAEWDFCIDLITKGGKSLFAYDEFKKVVEENGVLRIVDKRLRRLQVLSIGTIISEGMFRVQFLRGDAIGRVEEGFAAQLSPGDSFWLGGRHLEVVQIRDMTLKVKKAQGTKGVVPRWMGGRMPLSSQFAAILREVIEANAAVTSVQPKESELSALDPLFQIQRMWSHIPSASELLVEQIKSREGYHLFVYPFEGRSINEGMALLVAHRMCRQETRSISLAMNDYGFELLSERPFSKDHSIIGSYFDEAGLETDFPQMMNFPELAKRQFREIAKIAGLVFSGYPGKNKTASQLQASSSLIFDVFRKYEPENLLLLQASREVVTSHLGGSRLKEALTRARNRTMIVTTPKRFTPFSFPIMVDRLREQMSSEKLSDRIKRMYESLEADAQRDAGTSSG